MGKTRIGDLVSDNLISTDIDNDRVGIGSTLPSSKLDVSGDTNISGVVTANSFSGSGINLTGIVTSITAGDNISIDSSTGSVTITGLANTANVVSDTIDSGILNVTGVSTFNGPGTEVIRIATQTRSASSQEEFGIGFAANVDDTHPAALITYQEFDNDDFRGELAFYTRSSTGDTVPTEKMRITKDGDIGIGTNNPNRRLDVRGSGSVARFGTEDPIGDRIEISVSDPGYPKILNVSSSDTLSVVSRGSVQIAIDSNNSSTDKIFNVVSNGDSGSGTDLFRIDEDGEIAASGNINVAGVVTTSKLHVDPVGSGITYNEDLVVEGNARVTGILSIGTSSIILDSNAKTIRGLNEIRLDSDNEDDTPVIFRQRKGKVFFRKTRRNHSNQIVEIEEEASVGIGTTVSVNTSGIITASSFYGDGSNLTGLTLSQVSGAMGDVVDDTTPQLGGNLDLNSNDITGTGNINITGSGTFSGNVSIAGTLTYEDVTNVDSVGLITARSGVDVTGNISVTGTVDGRDVASDGTKLDGIESGATADQTASEILTAIKTVDGASSGLDADTLDGQEGTYYLNYNNFTNTPTIPSNVSDLTNDSGFITTSFTDTSQLTNGAGFITSADGGNADTLDGQEGTYYLNYNNFTNTPTIPSNVSDLTNDSGFITTSFTNTNQLTNGAGFITTSFTDTSQLTNGAGFITSADGGNADTLDGQEGTYYLNYNNFTNTPTIPTNNNQLTNGAGYITSFDITTQTDPKYLRSNAADTATGDITFRNNKLIFDNTTFSTFDWQNYQADGGDLTWTVGGTSGPEMELESDGSNYLNTELRVGGSKVWTAGNDGTGSGLDADTVDGLQGTKIYEASDTIQSNLDTFYTSSVFSYSNTTTGRPSSYGQGLAFVSNAKTYNGTNNWISQLAFSTGSGEGPYFRTRVNAGSWGGWTEIWNAGNDGSGSGLDADTVDGIQGASFLRSDATDSFSGTITNSGNFISLAGSASAANFNKIRLGRSTSQFMSFFGDSGGSNMIAVSSSGNPKANVKVGYSVDGGATVANTYTFTGSSGTVWTAGNDGSGSGLDADLLDGQNLQAGAATANTVVGRNGSGDIHCRLLRPTYGNQTTISGAMAFRVNNSTDNYVRFCSDTSAIRTFLGVTGTGSDGNYLRSNAF